LKLTQEINARTPYQAISSSLSNAQRTSREGHCC